MNACKQCNINTHQKALELNLHPDIYGSIAEVGAGQEVSDWFFRVGATSGTVAKTMSAYDMKVSDDIYGETTRYVSRDRVSAMLDHEYNLLEKRLMKSKGATTTFFAFGNSVAAKNFQGTNICHGWVGLRFQSTPGGKTNQIILHVNMRDDTNLLQQQALGVLGVNLIYGTFFKLNKFDAFITSLLDNLSLDRIEVDFIEHSGPDFEKMDTRQSNLLLLRSELCRALMFSPDNFPIAPVDVLYKRPIIIERGDFKTPKEIYTQLLDIATKQLSKRDTETKRELIAFPEITLNSLEEIKQVNDRDLLQRIDYFTNLKYPVMISSYGETYRLSRYLKRYTQSQVRFVSGIASLIRLLQEKYYHELDSGILSAVSMLLSQNIKIYVFSMDVAELKKQLQQADFDLSSWKFPDSGKATLHNISPRSHLRHLFAYLLEIGTFVPMKL